MAKNKIEIPKLILDHLLQYGHASILGLGTLYYNSNSAYLSDDKSQIFPPSNSLLFKDSTDNNDEFTHYVSNRLGISFNKASEKVEKYAQHILNQLLNYGKAEINAVGSFSKAKDDEIQFYQLEGEVNSKYYGLTPVKLKPIQFIKSGSAGINQMAVSTEAMPNRSASSVKSSSSVNTAPTSYNYNDDDDNSWLKPLLWIFGIVLLSLLLFKGCEKYKSQKKTAPPVEVDTNVVSNSSDINDAKQGESTVIDTIETKESNNPTECVIILGAYESARNAMKMSTKIAQMGYSPYEEYFDTMDVTRVGFKFNCGDKDLHEFMHEIRKDVAKDAWYLVPRITVE